MNVVVRMQEIRLESWKEIANYLKRDVTTVRRWEKEFALPVRRLQRKKLGAIYAYPGEIDGWLRKRTDAVAPAARGGAALALVSAGFAIAGAGLLLVRNLQRGR